MIDCEPIGTIATSFRRTGEAPSQGIDGEAEGTIHLEERYTTGLSGVEAGEDLVVVWFAHEADRRVLELRDGRGVFSTRSPARPNPVCLTTCRVTRVDPPEVGVRGVDMLDGSPVLDLKRPIG